MTINFDFDGDAITASSNTLNLSGANGAVTLPSGTTAQRPGTPAEGMYRFNNNTSAQHFLEVYQNGAWVAVTPISGAILTQLYYASNFENPNNADWHINALAAATVDATNNSIIVRSFNNTTETGVGFYATIPVNATNATFTFKGRPSTAPSSTSNNGVSMHVYTRQIVATTPAAVGSWSATNTLTTFALTVSSTNYQTFTQTIALSSFVSTLTAGNTYAFELTRLGGTSPDTLASLFYLFEFTVSFS
jgi:hypothetical protein